MNRVIVKAQDGVNRISKYIYGHFSEDLGRCIYGGYWVGNDPELVRKVPNTNGIRNDIIAALRKIKTPVIRWPGGCYADVYHWKDGIGSLDQRPVYDTTGQGGRLEDNSFGTHEFMELCSLVGCEPYMGANVGSGTVQELADWVEYCNSPSRTPMTALRKKNGRDEPWKVKYWGVGNENWGCGGTMRASYYIDTYRRYATYMRNHGIDLYKVACGSHTDYYEWTEEIMESGVRMDGKIRKGNFLFDGISLHYYTIPGEWAHKGDAVDFNKKEWFVTLRKACRIDSLLRNHGEIMDRYDPEKKIGLVVDEWGTWFDAEPGTNPRYLYQQNTIRDALVAGIHLNAFNNYCERVHMANIAQTVNVLQALILTEGAKMILTPTFHVFDLFKGHQNGLMLPVHVESDSYSGIPAVSASASLGEDKVLRVSLTNADPDDERQVTIDLRGFTMSSSMNIKGKIVTSSGITDHNTFDNPGNVGLSDFDACHTAEGVLVAALPPKSVVTLELN